MTWRRFKVLLQNLSTDSVFFLSNTNEKDLKQSNKKQVDNDAVAAAEASRVWGTKFSSSSNS